MNDKAIRFRFGIFVLTSLILLAVLTILFGGFPSYFKRTQPYKIIFTNAAGVAPGTPVRRSGVRIGEVRSVTLNNATGKVDVDIDVEEKYLIRKVDRPTIMQSLIGGDAAIAFLPPEDKAKDDPTPVPPGSVLPGVSPPDTTSLLQGTADLVQPAKEAIAELRKVFQGIDKISPVAEQTLQEFREVGKMANQIGPDMQRTSEELRLLAKTTREAIPEIRRTNEELQVTARNWGKVGERVDVLIKTNEEKISRSIESMDDALKRVNLLMSDENIRNARDTLKNVRDGSVQLESISKDTSELLKESRSTVKQLSATLKRADETLTDMQRSMKPFTDKGPAMFNNFNDSADNLNKTLKDVRELIQVIGRSDGTVQRLLTDPALYNNLNDSAEMVTKILPRFDRTLRDFEIFADKLARHPELFGIGGVLRPSSGLKESPTAPPYRTYPMWK